MWIQKCKYGGQQHKAILGTSSKNVPLFGIMGIVKCKFMLPFIPKRGTIFWRCNFKGHFDSQSLNMMCHSVGYNISYMCRVYTEFRPTLGKWSSNMTKNEPLKCKTIPSYIFPLLI